MLLVLRLIHIYQSVFFSAMFNYTVKLSKLSFHEVCEISQCNPTDFCKMHHTK